MSHANPALMLRLLKSTLSKNNVDYDRLAEEFGQLTSAERRRNRESFSLSDHVRGLVLSQLSANRPWKPIAANLSKLATLFKDYDWVYLKSVDPDILVSGILDLKCGSRTTRFQITSLKSNIETFEDIQRHFGQIDRFIEMLRQKR